MTEARKYLSHGEGVEVLAETETGYIVRRFVYSDDDEEYSGEIMEVNEVFDSPPKARIESEYSRLADRIKSAKDELKAILDQIVESKKNMADTIKEIEKNKGLERVQEFLRGNIKWFAVNDHYGRVKVADAASFLAQRDEYGSGRNVGIKLLGLFGTKEGVTRWAVNEYSDGSGSWTHANPHTTREDALADALEMLADRIAVIKGSANSEYMVEGVIQSFKEIGVDPPVEMKALYEIRLRREMENKIKQSTDERNRILSEFNAKLEGLKQ